MRPGALNLLRLLWLSLPVTMGPAVEDACGGSSAAVSGVVAIGLWLTYLDQQNRAMSNRLKIEEPTGPKNHSTTARK